MPGEQWIGGLGRSVLDDSQSERYLEPATLAEVVQALGITQDSARQLELRALKKMRQELLKRVNRKQPSLFEEALIEQGSNPGHRALGLFKGQGRGPGGKLSVA